jgi:predicted metalloprotease
MSTSRAIALLVAAGIGVAACGTEAAVTSQRADEIRTYLPPVSTPDDPTVTTAPTDPDTSTPATPPAPTGPVDPTSINFGASKPERSYDEFLLAVMTDLHAWWSQEYLAYYGETFVPLEGDVYAAYPTRPDDIPGCGTERTTYEEVQQYVAFYCGVGDFMVYDDGDDGLLAELAREYGAATIGTVFAHEFGHAIQLRSGALDRALPTILTEQQADCFAGAWTSRVATGESTLV